MTAYTSKANGNWNAGGQTTWNQTGTPASGDTAEIQNTHNVTVSVNVTVGDGSDTAVHVDAGGTLTIADGVTLTIIGNILQEGSIVMGDGSGIVFASAPSVSAVVAVFGMQSPIIARRYYRMS